MLAQETAALKKSLIEFAAHVELMIDESINGLLEENEETLRQVIETLEPKANETEIALEERCTILIAKFQPAAKELRTIMMVAQMNNDLERMGDLAVNIAESGLYLLERPRLKPFIDLPHMAKLTINMLKESIDAFIQEDVPLARGVCEKDPQIDDLKDQIYRELITYMISDTSNIERALQIMRISNSLERIADLSTNICEDTIFVVEGRVIKHHHNNTASNSE